VLVIVPRSRRGPDGLPAVAIELVTFPKRKSVRTVRVNTPPVCFHAYVSAMGVADGARTKQSRMSRLRDVRGLLPGHPEVTGVQLAR
jgi:hypothetical protein